MKIEKIKIESKLGSYIISREKGLPSSYEYIGEKVDYYKRNISQKMIFKRDNQLNEILGEDFNASIKKDGIFVGYYFNDKEKDYSSFFVNSPTQRTYFGLPINKILEDHLRNAGINEVLLVGELIASTRDPPDFEKRCRVYDLTLFTRSPKKENLERIGFKVIDIIEIDQKQFLKESFEFRDKELKRLFPKYTGIVSRIRRHKLKKEELPSFFERIYAEGMEGIVVQTNNISYKIKKQHTIDVAIIGYAIGRINSKLTSKQVASVLTALRYEDGSYQLLTRVGSGLDDKTRTNLFNLLSITKADSKEGYYVITGDQRVFQFVKPTIVSEILYDDFLIERQNKLLTLPCLKFNEKKNEWTFLRELPFPKLLHPVFSKNPIRDDKDPNNIKDIRINQITDLIDSIPPKKIKRLIFPKSEILNTIIFEKITKKAQMLKKFITVKTNKDKYDFPAYYVYYCDYSSSRIKSLKVIRSISIANTLEKITQETDKIIEKEMLKDGKIISGWNLYYGRIKSTFPIESLKKYDPQIFEKIIETEKVIEEEGEYEEEIIEETKKKEEWKKKYLNYWKKEDISHLIKGNIAFYRNEENKGFASINKVKKGSLAWEEYKAKFQAEINTPITLRTEYFKDLNKATEFLEEMMITDIKKWKKEDFEKEKEIYPLKIITEFFKFIDNYQIKTKQIKTKQIPYLEFESFSTEQWWDNTNPKNKENFLKNYILKPKFSESLLKDIIEMKWIEFMDMEIKHLVIYKKTSIIYDFFYIVSEKTNGLFIQIENNEILIDDNNLKEYWNNLTDDIFSYRNNIIKDFGHYKQVPKEFRESKWEDLSPRRKERIKNGLINFRKSIKEGFKI